MFTSVDKFGHHLSGRGTQSGPPGVGFKLDNFGNFDIEQKKLTNVKSPTEDCDAVTLEFLKNGKFLSIPKENFINLYSKRLVKLEDPIDETDAVNKRYLHKNISKKDPDVLTQSIFIEEKKNLEKSILNKCLQVREGEPIDIQNRHLINLPYPSIESDVITKKYFDEFVERINYNIEIINKGISQLDSNDSILQQKIDILKIQLGIKPT